MKKLAIIGYPVSHSLSPKMHDFMSDVMGHDYRYTAVETAPENLGRTVEMLKNDGVCGFNVTAPHKFEVMKYLDEISGDAVKYGAVNTVVNRGGKLYGYNTDAEGFYQSLLYEGINPKNADILILGAGGAAQPIVMHLSENGAKSITVVNRTRERTEKIKDNTEKLCNFEIDTEIHRDRFDIIINCTTLGMGKYKDKTPLEDLSLVDRNSAAADIIYSPPETIFLKDCKNKGAKTMNGLGMLVFQGILAYEIFSDSKLPDNIADRIFNEVMNGNDRKE